MKTLVILVILTALMTAIVPSAKANDNHESDLDKVAKTYGYVRGAIDIVGLLGGGRSKNQPANTGSLIPNSAQTNGPTIVVARFEGQDGDIAQQEVARWMQSKGYSPLAAADSMGISQIMQELQLENSQYGQGNNNVGQFKDARYLLSGKVAVIGAGENELRTKIADGTIKEMTVEVSIIAYDVRTRQMGAPRIGRGTARALTDLQIRQIRQNQYYNCVEADFRRILYVDLARQAIGQAVANALSNEPMAVVDQPARQDVVLTLATNGEGANQPATTSATTTANGNGAVAPTAPMAQERVGLTGNLILVIGNRKPMPITILSGKKLYVGDNIYFYHQGRTAGEYTVTGIEGNKVFTKIGYEMEKPELGDKFTITNR